MPKNLIPEIAKLLDVEIGEGFELDNFPGRYKFTEGHLEFYSKTDNDWHYKTNWHFMQLLIAHKLKIVKLTKNKLPKCRTKKLNTEGL